MKRIHATAADRRVAIGGVSRAALAGVCLVALAAAGARAEDWPALSKRLAAQCAAFKAAVQDITVDMEMTNPSTDGAIVTGSRLYQKGDRFRADISIGVAGAPGDSGGMEDFSTTIVDDGSSVWIVNPAMGKSEIPKEEGRKYRGQWYCSDYLPVDAEIVGHEKVSGRDCYILVVRDEGSSYEKIWIDARSLVPVKLEGKPEEGETTIAVFSDFRPLTGDIELPYTTEIYAGKDLISTVVIKGLAVNTGLPDKLFDADVPPGESTTLKDLLKRDTQKIEKTED